MAIIGYARISTKYQNLEMQIDALKQYGCEKIYHEVISTRKHKRFEFEKCIDFLRDGDVLVCYSLCRLARSHKELLEIKNKLDELNVSLYALQGNIDTSTNHGVLYFQIYASMLEFERNWGRDKVIDGLKTARARGRIGGRRPLLNNKQIEVLMDMYQSKKYTGKEIADHFNIKLSTAWKYIEREKLKKANGG